LHLEEGAPVVSLLLFYALYGAMVSAEDQRSQNNQFKDVRANQWLKSADQVLTSFQKVTSAYRDAAAKEDESEKNHFSDFEAIVADRLERWILNERDGSGSQLIEDRWKGLKDSIVGLELQKVKDGIEGHIYFRTEPSSDSAVASIHFFCHDHQHGDHSHFDCHYKEILQSELRRLKKADAKETDGHGSTDFKVTAETFVQSIDRSLLDPDFQSSKEVPEMVKIWKDRNDLRVVIHTSKPADWFSYCHFHKDGQAYCHASSRRGSNEPFLVKASSAEEGKKK
jgi:hypothetical protein